MPELVVGRMWLCENIWEHTQEVMGIPQQNGDTVDRDVALFGVKYEAAIVGGLHGEALGRIESQISAELGEDWKFNAHVIHGRNAVRQEHGLPKLGETSVPQARQAAPKRPLWRKLLGGRG
jgi:hypothetical protein